MDKIESEIERDENTIADIGEKLELVSNTNMVTKELLQKFVVKDVIKNKVITVAGQKFIGIEKELDISNQIIKEYEDYIGDIEVKNDTIDKICGDNLNDLCSEEVQIYKKTCINRFMKILNNIKRELQLNKY